MNRVLKYINKLESLYYNLAPALPVLVNLYRIGIVAILELLVLVIYPIIRPPLVVIVSIFYLTYLFHSDSFTNGELLSLNLEINSYMCSILDSSIGFFLSLHLILLVIKNGDKLKKSYPLVYNSIIIMIFFISVIFAISFYYNLNGLFNEIIIVLAKYIANFIVKMMGNLPQPSGPSAPGGSGQPSGGGGMPPENPGGSEALNSKKRKRANLSTMTPEELYEHKKNLTEAKNKRRKERFASKTEEEKKKFREHEREVKAKFKDSLPSDEIEVRKEIYNEKRRERYAEDAPFIKERRKELFAAKDEEDKEFIRENDRERYHNLPYMKEQKRLNMQKSRANKKKKRRRRLNSLAVNNSFFFHPTDLRTLRTDNKRLYLMITILIEDRQIGR